MESITEKKRCEFSDCKKKLNLVDKITGLCNCTHIYCTTHKPSYVHACTYDWKAHGAKTLEKTLVKVQADKLEIL